MGQPFEPVPTPASPAAAKRVSLDVLLTVLYVQIPRTARDQAAPIWNHVRENVLDAGTTWRLLQNGLRIGVGDREWWSAVKAQLDGIDGIRTVALDPVRLPPGYPLGLELDRAPREQTLFYMSDDGILTGETWPQSRNVLRVSYELNLADPERIRLLVVPEVRQRLAGWHYVRTDTGFTQAPNADGRAFTAAQVSTDVRPGEFLVVAPGPGADLYGMVGGAFLSDEVDGIRYDSYVFLQADVNYVAQRP